MPERDSGKTDASLKVRLRRWLRPRNLVWIAIALPVGAIILYALARPVYHAWRERRAEALAVEAAACLEAGRNEEASQMLSQAYRNNPSSPAVLRMIARMIQSSGGDAASAVHFWRELMKSGEATTADRAAMARTLLAAGQREEAQKMMAGFSPSERASREVMELEAALLRADGRTTQADELLRRALLSDPDNPECILKLAALDLAESDDQTRQTITEKLWTVARSRTGFALQAISMLAGTSVTEPQARELLDLVQRHRTANAAVRYQVLSTYLKLRPKERQLVFDNEVESRRGTPPESSLDLLRWLVVEGEYDRVLKLVPENRALTIPALFPAYVEALAGQQRWKELRDLLRSTSTLQLTPAYLSLLQARCSHGLGDPPEQVRGQLQEACRRAFVSRDFGALVRATGIAEKVGYPDVAVTAFQEASAIPQLNLPAMEGLLGVHTRQRNTEAVFAILQQVQAARPGVRVYQERLLYLKLLIGLEMEVVTGQLPVLVAGERISPQAAGFMQALAAYRMADMDKVRDKLTKVDASHLPEGQRAVLAGMLHAVGDKEHAAAVAEKVGKSTLLPEEEKLLPKSP